MKIAQVCHVFLPHMGGLEFFVDRLNKSLKEKEINSKIITTDMNTPKEGRIPDVEYNRVNFSYMRNPFSYELIKHFMNNSYELIQLHSIWFIPSFEALLFRKNAKIVTIVHGVYPDNSTLYQKIMLNIYKPIAKYILSKSDSILVQSISEKEKLLKIFNVKEKKVEIIYNGIILEKNKRKIKNMEKILLFTGRIISDKNPDILIKAGGILNKKGYNFKIKYIGPIEEEFKKELLNLAESNGIKEKVIFIPNIPPEKRDSLMKEYASSFIAIAIGSWEGMPNRLMEAMQFGVPCIAYGSGGTAELIKHMENGILINKLDDKELAGKIEILFNDKNLYKRLGKEAKKTVENKFDWKNSFNIIYDNYKKVLKEQDEN
jgi:glycosyltransferase involved in cell wall biosynthesis